METTTTPQDSSSTFDSTPQSASAPISQPLTASQLPSIPQAASNRFLPFILLGVLSLVWGSSFILIKRSLVVFAPLEVAALRMTIAAMVLLPFAAQAWKNAKRSDLKFFLMAGLLGNGIPAILFTLAQRHLNSSTVALLNSLTPLFTLLIGTVIFRSQAVTRQIIGVTLGFCGAVALILAAQQEGQAPNGAATAINWYVLLPICATIGYGFNANVISRKLQGVEPMTINSLGIASVALLYMPYLIGSGFATTTLPAAQAHPKFWLALGSVALLAALGTALSNILYTRLIQLSGPLFSSSVTYLIPVVALVWGVLDGESLGSLHFIGIGIILAGIYLVNKRS
jgi:drug/metabolite transporter (DMT)-like permease